MDENYKLKMAAIAGASRALKFAHKNPRANEDEVLRHVTENLQEIIKKIDSEDA